jgi:beta-N-acetylglucosaminidase
MKRILAPKTVVVQYLAGDKQLETGWAQNTIANGIKQFGYQYKDVVQKES